MHTSTIQSHVDSDDMLMLDIDLNADYQEPVNYSTENMAVDPHSDNILTRLEDRIFLEHILPALGGLDKQDSKRASVLNFLYTCKNACRIAKLFYMNTTIQKFEPITRAVNVNLTTTIAKLDGMRLDPFQNISIAKCFITSCAKSDNFGLFTSFFYSSSFHKLNSGNNVLDNLLNHIIITSVSQKSYKILSHVVNFMIDKEFARLTIKPCSNHPNLHREEYQMLTVSKKKAVDNVSKTIVYLPSNSYTSGHSSLLLHEYLLTEAISEDSVKLLEILVVDLKQDQMFAPENDQELTQNIRNAIYDRSVNILKVFCSKYYGVGANTPSRISEVLNVHSKPKNDVVHQEKAQTYLCECLSTGFTSGATYFETVLKTVYNVRNPSKLLKPMDAQNILDELIQTALIVEHSCPSVNIRNFVQDFKKIVDTYLLGLLPKTKNFWIERVHNLLQSEDEEVPDFHVICIAKNLCKVYGHSSKLTKKYF